MRKQRGSSFINGDRGRLVSLWFCLQSSTFTSSVLILILMLIVMRCHVGSLDVPLVIKLLASYARLSAVTWRVNQRCPLLVETRLMRLVYVNQKTRSMRWGRVEPWGTTVFMVVFWEVATTCVLFHVIHKAGYLHFFCPLQIKSPSRYSNVMLK